jgi:hypothetical protein
MRLFPSSWGPSQRLKNEVAGTVRHSTMHIFSYLFVHSNHASPQFQPHSKLLANEESDCAFQASRALIIQSVVDILKAWSIVGSSSFLKQRPVDVLLSNQADRRRNILSPMMITVVVADIILVRLMAPKLVTNCCCRRRERGGSIEATRDSE